MIPKVTVIILNWNGWEDTIECLESLYQIEYSHYNVIIVDNASTNNSIEQIKRYTEGKIEVKSDFFEYDQKNKPIKILEYNNEEYLRSMGGKIFDLALNKKLILIKNDKNYGFAEANNIGLKYALKNLNVDYFLLLNNDTIVYPKFLTELVKVSEKDTRIGIAGPKIYPLTNGVVIKDKAIIGSKISFWKGGLPIGLKNGDQIKDVDLISGACILIKKETLLKLGFLDSIYFFGWEDADYCTKAKRSGYRVIGVSNSKILHKIGASYENFSKHPEILSNGIKNQLIFMDRYSSKLQYIISIPFICFFYLLIIFQDDRKIFELKKKIIAIMNGIEEYRKSR
jgi:GT2 family glycosyltransferase